MVSNVTRMILNSLAIFLIIHHWSIKGVDDQLLISILLCGILDAILHIHSLTLHIHEIWGFFQECAADFVVLNAKWWKCNTWVFSGIWGEFSGGGRVASPLHSLSPKLRYICIYAVIVICYLVWFSYFKNSSFLIKEITQRRSLNNFHYIFHAVNVENIILLSEKNSKYVCTYLCPKPYYLYSFGMLSLIFSIAFVDPKKK